MNIETLLQAAQILESQQSVPPTKRIAIGDRTTNNHPIPASVLSSTTVNRNVAAISASTSSLLKADQITVYPQVDFNINLCNLIKQNLPSDDDDDDDEDDNHVLDQNNHNTERNNDVSNRGQGGCFRDREIHNRLEKNRRAHLKDCFDTLKSEVPCQRDRKITNLQILNLAIKYIRNLTRKERAYEREISQLTSRNIELQQRLNTLKSDLSSDGHNLDTWLSSCTDIDHSISTRTASEAEMHRTYDDNDDDGDSVDNNFNSSTTETKFLDGNGDLDSNNNHHDMKSNIRNSYTIDQKILLNNCKDLTIRQRTKPPKRKVTSIPTTNLLQSLTTTIPTRPENILDYTVARNLQLDQPCNLLTTFKDTVSSTKPSTPITDIRYDIVDLFTKGTTSQLQQQQTQHLQMSPLPSIASLMNRHTSPVVSPTKQTIGINTDPLTTSTTNILHQSVAMS